MVGGNARPLLLGSTRLLVAENGTITAQNDYEPFGDNMVVGGTTYNERLGFTGKETDKESKLGDFGARKYAHGRFWSCDALWEKYRAWTPYQYSVANPLGIIDPNGKDIIILNHPDTKFGYGHSAILIGNDVTGWTYFSADGERFGKDMDTERRFQTLEEFTENPKIHHYKRGVAFRNTDDEAAIKKARERLAEEYSHVDNHCADLVREAAKAGGVTIERQMTKVVNLFALMTRKVGDPYSDIVTDPNAEFNKFINADGAIPFFYTDVARKRNFNQDYLASVKESAAQERKYSENNLFNNFR